MSSHNKSLAELFGKLIPLPPVPIETSSSCPFINETCKKSAGIDDKRLRPSGACSIWFNCNFLTPPTEKAIIICPYRFYTNSYNHLWSLVKEMVSIDLDNLILVPEVANIDWVIYSPDEEVVGAIEVQSIDTTGSYKPQLFYLRGIDDSLASQYPQTVNANWANATYKRFYPQVVQTIATMDQFNAPVGLLTQDIFSPYLVRSDRFPSEEIDKEDAEVVWSFLNVDKTLGSIENMSESFMYFSKKAIKEVILKFSHPSTEVIFEAIIRQLNSGRGIKYINSKKLSLTPPTNIYKE